MFADDRHTTDALDRWLTSEPDEVPDEQDAPMEEEE